MSLTKLPYYMHTFPGESTGTASILGSGCDKRRGDRPHDYRTSRTLGP